MDVNSSAVLPPAAGIICLVDDDLSMLKALDRLLSSVGLQAQLFSEPHAFLSYATFNCVALAAGAIAYFDKPFDDDAFLAAVHQAMA